MKTNQILIWPSWTWKSSKWKELARIQWKNFIDFDNDILENISQQTAIDIFSILDKNSEEKLKFNPYQLINTSVAHILDLVWSDNFIKIEEYLTLKLDLQNTVLATSWSQVLSDKAMKHLNNIWDTIYLNEELGNIMKRTHKMKLNRIVWMPFDLDYMSQSEIIKKYKEIMLERLNKYVQYSNLIYKNKDFEENRKKSIIKNKNWIPILENWNTMVNNKKDIQLNFENFLNFLKDKWIVRI